MSKIVILGAGVMGAAMAMPGAVAGSSVTLIGTHLDTEIIRSVRANGWHPGLSIRLPKAVTAHEWTESEAILGTDPDMVVIGVASAGVEWAIERLVKGLNRPVPIVMITKGLFSNGTSIEILPKLVRRKIAARRGFDLPITAVGGPCIAGELAALRDTSVIVTGETLTEIELVRKFFAAPFYHARASTDVIGVEVCAAFKNFFAIAVGSILGRLEREVTAPSNAALMHNLTASAFTQALSEMTKIVTALGGDAETVSGLSGTGDLYVTCQAGRNGRMGRLLGLGHIYSRAKKDYMPHDTVEGANLTQEVGSVLKKMLTERHLFTDEMPMTCALIDAICHDAPLDLKFSSFHRMVPDFAKM